MATKTAPAAAVFEKVLRAYETGGFTYTDVRTQLQRLLEIGAVPSELLEILRRQESWEPLPQLLHEELLGMLEKAAVFWNAQQAASPTDPDAGATPVVKPAPKSSPEAIDRDEADHFRAAFAVVSTGKPDRGRNTDSLQERVRSVESAAAVRVTALAADLAAARTALEFEKNRSREIEKQLADAVASNSVIRSSSKKSLEESQRHQVELSKLRDQFVVRQGDVAKLQRSLDERDAELAALKSEHAKSVPEFETRLSAQTAELAKVTAALELERNKSRDTELQASASKHAAGVLQSHLDEREAALSSLRSDHARVQLESEGRASALRARDQIETAALELERSKFRDAELQVSAAKQAAGVLQSRLDEREAELAALKNEQAKFQPLLEARLAAQAADFKKELAGNQAAVSARTAMDLQIARGRIAILETDLAAAALATKDAAARDLEVQKESERRHGVLRDSLADREARIATLERESARLSAESEKRAKFNSESEAELNNVRWELNGLRLQSNSYLELLRNRESRGAADQEEVRVLTSRLTAVEADRKALQTERDQLQAQNANLRSQPVAHDPVVLMPTAANSDADEVEELPIEILPVNWVSTATPQKHGANAAMTASSIPASTPAPTPTPRSSAGGIPRVAAYGAGAVVLVALIWALAHRKAAPVPAVVEPTAAAVAVAAAGTIIRDCATCPGMTVVPAGRFNQGTAGADNSGPFERPMHAVSIGQPFAMSTNVVTVAQFQEFVTATGASIQGCDIYDGAWKHRPKNSWSNPGFVQTGEHPATCLSWNDAIAYAAWLSKKTGQQYRLPSASEMEYAARSGGEAIVPWSTDGSGACENANVADRNAAHRYPGWKVFACDDGYVYTSPVGSFKANAFGLNDTLGNVFQWTQDCWHADYNGAPADGSARLDGNCAEHELRGGSWFSTPAYVRANYRNHFATDYRSSTVGIRLVRELLP